VFTNITETPNIKSQGIPCSGYAVVTWEQTERKTDMTKLRCAIWNPKLLTVNQQP